MTFWEFSNCIVLMSAFSFLLPTIHPINADPADVINAIIDEAEKNGYLVIILQSNESIELERKQVELLINKRVEV